MALVDRTAYPRLPTTVSERELAETFTPTAEEVAWACATIVEPGTRLLLLVLLKCYQRLGYFPQLDRVPGAGDRARARPGRGAGNGPHRRAVAAV
jgi:hypothetical protein